MQPASAVHPFLCSPRTPHLLKFWQELCALTELPQVDRWLSQRFRQDKRLGKKDRLWYADAFFAAFRYGLWALHCEAAWAQVHPSDYAEGVPCAGPASADPAACWQNLRRVPAERLFLWLQLRIFPDHPWTRERAEWSACDARQARSVALEERLLDQGVPEFYLPFLQQQWQAAVWSQAEVDRFLGALNQRAPIWLRFADESSKQLFLQELQQQHIEWREREGAVALPADSRVTSLPAFQQGKVEIQDWASQAIGCALPVGRTGWIWDCCAGSGGKSLQLASRTASRILASDIRGYKLQELRERARQAGFQNIETLVWDGQRLPSLPLEVQRAGGFAGVLVDAPCSSSGTWRRNPDARFRLTQAGLEQLLVLQKSILQTAAEAVQVGGFLCYATCSWLGPENQGQVENFLQRHKGFKLIEQKLCGSPEEDADTMFWALMQKVELS